MPHAERRDTLRVPVTLEAIIGYRGNDYHHAVTRDISLDGVSIKARPGEDLPKGPVDLAISLPHEGDKRFYRFRAELVHRGKNSAGFTFDSVDSDAYEALMSLVFSRQPAGAL